VEDEAKATEENEERTLRYRFPVATLKGPTDAWRTRGKIPSSFVTGSLDSSSRAPTDTECLAGTSHPGMQAHKRFDKRFVGVSWKRNSERS
jgi:hypothetical protein